MALYDTMTAAYQAAIAAYSAAKAPAPVMPPKSRFVLFFPLPPTATQATTIAASLRKTLGAQYIVGIGRVWLSVEYRP